MSLQAFILSKENVAKHTIMKNMTKTYPDMQNGWITDSVKNDESGIKTVWLVSR